MQGKPISPRPTASTPAGCTSIFVLLLSFLAALARMFFGKAALLVRAGSAFAVGEPVSRKVPARVKANKASAPAGWHRPSLGRSHVFYLLAALHLCVSAVAGYSHAAGAAALNATAPNLTALNSTGEYGNHKASDDQPARSNLFAPCP